MQRSRWFLATLFLAGFVVASPAHAEGPFVGADLGIAEPTNGNFRGHVKHGAALDPYVGYMFNDYLGAQGELHIDAFSPDVEEGRVIRNEAQTSTLLGGTIGPRLSIPLLDLLEVYGTAQGGVFTGLSGRLNHTGAGFSVGGGIDFKLTKTIALSAFGRWNRAYMSPSPKDLDPVQLPGERFASDIQWATAGIGVKFMFPPAPPAPQPTPAPVIPTPVAHEQKRIVLRAVNFDFDKADIRPDARPILDEAAEILKQEGGIAVICEGHTDAIGTVEYNQKLSQRRAQSVRDYLVAHGIAPSRIRTEGFGKSRPVATNDTPDGRAQNRRVELRVQ